MNPAFSHGLTLHSARNFLHLTTVSEILRYPRYLRERLIAGLQDAPVVLIHGPRQSGKTTLALSLGMESGYDYLSFDDVETLQAAERDPTGFVRTLPERIILDEVQRVPGLFSTIKSAIDRDRKPGRFILTGSANILLISALSDSLAGRMDIFRLHPLAQSEIEETRPGFIDRLFQAEFSTGTQAVSMEDLYRRILSGGYPSVLGRESLWGRQAWYRNYIETIIKRDVRDLSQIRSLDALPRLLKVAAGQTARLVNVADLAGNLKPSRTTIADYIALLEQIFLVSLLPAWSSNRLKRSVRKPKLHLGDAGLATALIGIDGPGLQLDREFFGQIFETFVYQELVREASWSFEETGFHHYRTREKDEVDIVLERGGGRIAGVEVKSAATVSPRDFRGLEQLRDSTGQKFACGAVLYTGERRLPFGDRLWAIPVADLWTSP